MDSFARAKTVRLRSYQEKYLAAEDDGEHVHVSQKRDSSGLSTLWAVERIDDAPHGIRLRSSLCGRYLTATDEYFLLGVTGKKVRLTLPPQLDSSLEWEPLRDGAQIKLKNRYGNYLRDDKGNVDDSVEWPAFIFNGTSVPELTEKLKEETRLADIVVCTRNPLNHQLIPLLLHLPPNNATMRLVVVEANSRVAKMFNL